MVNTSMSPNSGSVAPTGIKRSINSTTTSSSVVNTTSSTAAELGKATATTLPFGAINPTTLAATTTANLAATALRYSTPGTSAAPPPQQNNQMATMLAGLAPMLGSMFSGFQNLKKDDGENKKKGGSSNNSESSGSEPQGNAGRGNETIPGRRPDPKIENAKKEVGKDETPKS